MQPVLSLGRGTIRLSRPSDYIGQDASPDADRTWLECCKSGSKQQQSIELYKENASRLLVILGVPCDETQMKGLLRKELSWLGLPGDPITYYKSPKYTNQATVVAFRTSEEAEFVLSRDGRFNYMGTKLSIKRHFNYYKVYDDRSSSWTTSPGCPGPKSVTPQKEDNELEKAHQKALEEIRALKEAKEQLEASQAKLRSELDESTRKANELARENKQLLDNHDQLQEELSSSTTQNLNLQATLNETMEENRRLKGDNGSCVALEKKVNSLQCEVQRQQEGRRKLVEAVLAINMEYSDYAKPSTATTTLRLNNASATATKWNGCLPG